jgi:oxygen-dependent protoporphyrinogen oxidase
VIESSTLVLGGGFSGLVFAHERKKRGEEALVLDSAAEPGGAARTVAQEGFLLELGPNTVRESDALIRLAREAGLENEILFAPRLPRFIEWGGKLRKVPFAALGIAGMLRGAAGLLLPRGDGEETVYCHFERRFGRSVADRLASPFVSGIWAGDARRLVARHAFPTLFGARREGKRGHRLLSFRGGLSALPRALASGLGDRSRAGVGVSEIVRRDGGFSVSTSLGEVRCERLVVATSASEAARLSAGIAPAASEALSRVYAPPLAVAHCAWNAGDFDRPLAGFGHLVVPGEARILGAVWSSCLFPGRAPGGQVLITVFLGGTLHPEIASLPEEQILASVDEDARRVLGARRPPRLLRVTRHAAAIPQYDGGHGALLAALDFTEREIPGLRFLGNYRGGVSVPDVVDSAISSAG